MGGVLILWNHKGIQATKYSDHYVGAKALPSVAQALLQAAGRKILAAWFGAWGLGIRVWGFECFCV